MKLKVDTTYMDFKSLGLGSFFITTKKRVTYGSRYKR